jgi:hypothetical protein
MDKETVLLILLKLEQMRLRVERKESSLNDNTIRLCQAEIAKEHFQDRKEWTNILKAEYGLEY